MEVRTLMRRAAAHYAGLEAVVHGERRLTFQESWRRSLRLANALLAAGLKPGDRVGVLEDNSVEAADLFGGAAAANVVRVPLYPRNGRDAQRHMLAHTGCRLLIVGERLAPEVAGIADELPDLEQVWVRDSSYENWVAKHPDTDPDVPIDENDNFIIRHTGGTTGKSKGVAYTHKAWLAAGRDWFYAFPPVEPRDKCMHLGPISHGSGYQYLPIWLSGGCNVMLDHFNARETLDIIERAMASRRFMPPERVRVSDLMRDSRLKNSSTS